MRPPPVKRPKPKSGCRREVGPPRRWREAANAGAGVVTSWSAAAAPPLFRCAQSFRRDVGKRAREDACAPGQLQRRRFGAGCRMWRSFSGLNPHTPAFRLNPKKSGAHHGRRRPQSIRDAVAWAQTKPSVTPGIAIGYQPFSSGCTGASLSQVRMEGISCTLDSSASSHLSSWPE